MSRHSAKGATWEAQRQRVLNRDDWRCSWCGKPLEGSDATVDHIDPIVNNAGRDYRDDELMAMCRKCNGLKSDKALVRQPYYNARWLDRV